MTAWIQRDKLLNKKVWSFKIDLTKGVVIHGQGCGYLPTKGCGYSLKGCGYWPTG